MVCDFADLIGSAAYPAVLVRSVVGFRSLVWEGRFQAGHVWCDLLGDVVRASRLFIGETRWLGLASARALLPDDVVNPDACSSPSICYSLILILVLVL